MLGGSKRELLICFNERKHGIVVGRGIVAGDVALYATLSSGATFSKLLDQVVGQELVGRSRLYKLQEELCRRARFFDTACQLSRRR